MNVRKYEKKQKEDIREQGEKYDVKNMADTSLDTNRKVAEIEDKPLSSVASISPTRKTNIMVRLTLPARANVVHTLKICVVEKCIMVETA